MIFKSSYFYNLLFAVKEIEVKYKVESENDERKNKYKSNDQYDSFK